MKLTKEDILKIAGLAKISLSETELEAYYNEFNSIIDYISQLSELDLTGAENIHNLQNYVGDVLYEDLASKSKISRDNLLLNATKGRSKNGYIRTSKIVEKD